MICLAEQRPRLEIPSGAWIALDGREFVNLRVPLMREPVEFEGRLYWDGAVLTMASPDSAGFATLDDLRIRMPYDELFRVVEGPDGRRAQIYSAFFERVEDGEWGMVYRLMDLDRTVFRDERDLPGYIDDGLPTSRWSLTSTEMSGWLSRDAFIDHFCPMAGRDGYAIDACVSREIQKMGMTGARVRMMLASGGMAIAAPEAGRCCASVIDLARAEVVSRLAMDDPSDLIARFWRLSSKIFLTPQERGEKVAVESEAWHYAQASRAALASCETTETLTAAAFYC